MNQQFNHDHYLDAKFHENLHLNPHSKIDLKPLLKSLFSHKDKNHLLYFPDEKSNATINKQIDLKTEKSLTIINDINDNLSYNSIIINAYTNCDIFLLNLPNRSKTKNNITLNLKKDIQVKLNVFTESIAGQLYDDSINVIHGFNHSQSIINYVSYVKGKVVCQINSIIPKEYNGCETSQSIRNVLLSKNAIVFSKPSLQIENPNVIASHGNATSEIQPEYIGYLSQRGINIEIATALIKKSDYLSTINGNFYFDLLKELYE